MSLHAATPSFDALAGLVISLLTFYILDMRPIGVDPNRSGDTVTL